eukprot:7638966-Lingulodinium_polyedra.AAC.1
MSKKRPGQAHDRHAQRKHTAAKATRAQSSPAHACGHRTEQRRRKSACQYAARVLSRDVALPVQPCARRARRAQHNVLRG